MFIFQKTLRTAIFLFTSIFVFAQDTPNETQYVIQWQNFLTSFTILLDSTVSHQDIPNGYTSDLYDEALIMVFLMDTTGNSLAEIG